MSQLGNEPEDLIFVFIGTRGLEIGSIFFQLIKEDYKGKRYDILNFFAKVFFVCETEKQFREIGSLIEGYVPEENVLLMGELNTSGDLWSNIEENDDILANRVFSPLMFAVDQFKKPRVLLFYNLSNGKQAGICDYLLQNFPLVKSDMPIYIIATTSIDEGAGAMSIYWSILGLNSIIEGVSTHACILLDYEAIGNSIYLHRLKKFEEFDFESYNYVVANLIYALTHYDREPYANAVPFCQMIEKLVIFEDMKFIIPFMTMPRRELIEDEKFSGYLNELVNDCNLFTIRYLDESDAAKKAPKLSIANAFIAFGERQDTDYLNLIRNNLPPIIEYLPGSKSFYTYPRGAPFSIFLENNTVIRQYFQDLLEKFDILISHHSYLHVLEDLGITSKSFEGALDKLISLVDSYQECEDLLYDEEDFDYEAEIEKYQETDEDEEIIDEKYQEREKDLVENEGISPESEVEGKDSEKLTSSSRKKIEQIGTHSEQIIKDELASTDNSTKINAKALTELNEASIKENNAKWKRAKKRKKIVSEQGPSLIMREGDLSTEKNVEIKEEGALKWLEMRASKEKEKISKEKDEILKHKEDIERQKKEFEEAQEQIRLEEEQRKREEEEQVKEKQKELKKLAKMFDSL